MVTIDPRLPMLPVTGTEYEERLEPDYFDLSDDSELLVIETSPDAVFFEYDEEFDEPGLEPPSNVAIISQTVKVGSGGQASVDIILEIEDVVGASEYEKRESTT